MPRSTQLALIAAVAIVATGGCSRQSFRERTDKDVEAIISQKNVVPKWQVQNWHVYPDPRARYADPSNPDFPPYPPDDYATKVLSPNPQRPGQGGVGRNEGDGYIKQITEWDAQNRAEDGAGPPGAAAGPAAASDGGATADGSGYKVALQSNERMYRIRLDQAVELGLYNSREFQDRREDLYLAALPVSLERFGFSAQAFAAERMLLSLGGRETSPVGQQWQINTSAGFGRRFSTGAALLVQLANQVVVDLSSGRPSVSAGTLGLTLTQPFLRGGGFAVTLEALTQAERNLVYAIRSFAHFRSVFFVALTGQGDYTNSPYGLQGLSVNLGRGIGSNLTANPVGYLPTILRSAILANERSNVAAFEQYLRQYQNLEEGGAVNKLQVGRIEQQLLQGRVTVLLRTQEYIDNIDNFKLQLGLPATFPLELDETPLRPIRDQLGRIEQVYEQFRQFEAAAGRFDVNEPAAALRDRWRKLLTDSDLTRGSTLAKQYPEAADRLKGRTNDDLNKLAAGLRERRRQLLDARAEKLKAGQSVDAEDRELEQGSVDLDRAEFELSIRRYEARPWAGEADVKKREGLQATMFREVLNNGMLVVVPARNQRLDELRTRWPDAPALVVDDRDLIRAPLDDAYQSVEAAALNNRYDLMNARAQVVDAWRQVAVTANALQGVFDVEYDLSTNSPPGGSRPLALGGSRLLQQVRLRIEPPFVRRAERNQYRAALIAYQRQRRTLIAYEDNVVTDVRTDLRALRQLAQTFLVQQRAVELAYAQVDNARLTINAPPDPRADASAGAAAQTEQLLNVQAALVRAQNDLYTSWVRYLTARMTLYLDLELLPLDPRGIWSDVAPAATPPATTPPAAPGPANPALPERLPQPEPLTPDRDRPAGVPVLSLPDPDVARPLPTSTDRPPDPFPPIRLPGGPPTP
jgi:hypothetical protein